jgi:hypothetical protein
MARVKAVTSFQSRLFQFWVFASLAFGAVSLLLGLDLLRGETIIYNLIPADAFDGLGAVWTAIFIWFLYQSLTFARDSGDTEIRRPIVWLILTFVPLVGVYMAFSAYPRIIPPWIKRMTQIPVSPRQVLVYMLLNALANVSSRLDSYEALSFSILASGVAMVSLVWVLRDVLLGKRAS